MWNVACLVHDDPSEEIKNFFVERWSDGIHEVEIRDSGEIYDKNLYNSCEIQDDLKELSDVKDKPLTVYGHGSFHHYTYGIVGNTMPQRTSEFLYVHIDYHTDAGIRKDRSKCNCGTAHGLYKCGVRLDCGAFVMNLKDHGAKNFLFVGTDMHCGWKRKEWISQDTLMNEDIKTTMAHQLQVKRCHDVYISMDLDVLSATEIPTGYGRGKIDLRKLLAIIESIQEHKNIIGADILGLCRSGCGSHVGRGNRSNDYYQPTGYLTYAIIAAQLAGKDITEAMKVRDYLIDLDFNKKNGVKWEDMAKGLKL